MIEGFEIYELAFGALFLTIATVVAADICVLAFEFLRD